MIHRDDLRSFLDDFLETKLFEDYGPNGLQVEGRSQIGRVAFAVSASREVIEATAAWSCDGLVVHHGLFWNAQGARPLVGALARRIRPLIVNDINLFAYHLPLDAHPVVGNAAGLAKALGLEAVSAFGDHKGRPVGVQGVFDGPLRVRALRDRLAGILQHEILQASLDADAEIRSIGIVTGGASGGWRQALDAGLDVYVTGEMSEHDWHDSREAGMHMLAGGHTATETFGVRALMTEVSARFGLDCRFFPSDNPV